MWGFNFGGKAVAQPTSNKEKHSLVKKVSFGARVLDAGLCVLFAWFALTSDTVFWQIFWGLGAAFCAYTAATGPLERIPALVQRLMGVRKS